MRKPKFENWPHWFRSFWPGDARRLEVLRGYMAFGQTYKSTLADIALRNNVFAAINVDDAHAAGIAEGRRQCALEIVKLANVDIMTLFEMTKIDRTHGS